MEEVQAQSNETLSPVVCGESEEEPLAPTIDRLAGSSLQQIHQSRIFVPETDEAEGEESETTTPRVSTRRNKINHLKQGKQKVFPVAIPEEEHMQLHEQGIFKFSNFRSCTQNEEDS